MSSKNNPGAFDCYANAAPDEEMFVLLGRDPFAGALVRRWSALRTLMGEDPKKVAEANACADRLDAWVRACGKEPIADALEVAHFHIGKNDGVALFTDIWLGQDQAAVARQRVGELLNLEPGRILIIEGGMRMATIRFDTGNTERL